MSRQRDSEALPPKDILCGCAKRPNGLQAKRSKNSGALSFSGLGRAGRGETPFLFAQTSDDENLENIREKETLRNTESKAENQENTELKRF